MALNFTRKRYLALKEIVYKLDRGLCHICHKKVKFHMAVLDHIIPETALVEEFSFDRNAYWNLRAAHKRCNCQRSNGRIVGQIRLPLSPPKEVN